VTGAPPDDGKPGRRKLLLGLAASAGVAVAARASALAGQGGAAGKPPARRRRWGMVIDLGRCARCGGCAIACQQENNVAPLPVEHLAKLRPIHWMDFLAPAPGQPGPLGDQPAPIPCMHCEDPPCVQVCPVGATYRTGDGITAQIWDRCIGCRHCMVACPYARRYFNWTAPAWPGGETSALNPDVAPRPAGVVEKCTLCHHRIAAALERARVDEEPIGDEALRRLPACAQSCPAGAITFGDLDDPASEVARLAASARAVRLLPEAGTRPKVIYLRAER
jgi:molybdopterin-containing oxidoreductase family iron-sulfur binding subunit